MSKKVSEKVKGKPVKLKLEILPSLVSVSSKPPRLSPGTGSLKKTLGVRHEQTKSRGNGERQTSTTVYVPAEKYATTNSSLKCTIGKYVRVARPFKEPGKEDFAGPGRGKAEKKVPVSVGEK